MRTLAASYISEKNKLTNRPIRLYIVESGGLAVGEVLRFAEYGENVDFGLQTYYAAPLSCEAVTENMNGQIDQVTVSFGNVDRSFVHYLEAHDGLRNCKVTIKTVYADLLNESDAFTDDILYVATASMSQQAASFVLKSKLDLLGIDLPLRRFYRSVCQWKFKTSECKYAGGETTCNHTIQRCDALNNLVNFGGFPGTGAAIWRVYAGIFIFAFFGVQIIMNIFGGKCLF